MIKKLKQLSVIIATTLMMAVPTLTPALVHAESAVTAGACEGVNTATTTADGSPTSETCNTETDNGRLNDLIRDVINIFSIIVGAISVLMLIYGGFKYITSTGDSGKVTSAKNTIMYALIGLAIVGLSQVIVYFVLTKSTDIATV